MGIGFFLSCVFLVSCCTNTACSAWNMRAGLGENLVTKGVWPCPAGSNCSHKAVCQAWNECSAPSSPCRVWDSLNSVSSALAGITTCRYHTHTATSSLSDKSYTHLLKSHNISISVMLHCPVSFWMACCSNLPFLGKSSSHLFISGSYLETRSFQNPPVQSTWVCPHNVSCAKNRKSSFINMMCCLICLHKLH